MAKRKKKNQNVLAHKAALRKVMVRQGAFEPGRYSTKVRKDRRKEANRRACRGRVKE